MRDHAVSPFGLLACVTAALAPGPATGAPDTVAECRAAHAGDAAAYVRCLEAALEARTAGEEPRGEPQEERVPATEAGSPGGEPLADASAEELSVRIVATSYNARGLGTFRMEDGQVWRETTPSPPRRRLEPGRQYTARIVRGALGGYRMHVEGVRWMKTVERIE